MSLSESAQRDISKKDDGDEKEKQEESNQSDQCLKDVAIGIRRHFTRSIAPQVPMCQPWISENIRNRSDLQNRSFAT